MNTDKFNIRFIILSISLFIVTFLLSNVILDSYNQNDLSQKNDPVIPVNTETEVALTYFGCSTCPAANNEDIPALITKIALKFRANALSKDYRFILIGTSKESNVKTGLSYLNKIADFDEIALGNGMGNTTLQHFVWKNFDNPLSASVPQIIISRRKYETRIINNNKTILPIIDSEQFLTRAIGVSQMESLLQDDEIVNLL